MTDSTKSGLEFPFNGGTRRHQPPRRSVSEMRSIEAAQPPAERRGAATSPGGPAQSAEGERSRPTTGTNNRHRRKSMAANIQLVFYRKAGSDEVLVKFLLNENETSIPVRTDCAPYYRWDDVKRYWEDRYR